MERSAGFVRQDRELRLQKDVAGVETFVHVDDGDACLGVAGRDRRLDGRRAAILRKERGVQIQTGDPRNLEHALRQDLAIGHDDDHVRRERANLRDCFVVSNRAG